jgi:hypothetical protein
MVKDLNQMDFFAPEDLSNVTMTELDAIVKELEVKRKIYSEKKGEASAANDEVEAIEGKIMAILEAHNKTKYSVDGVGTVYTVDKFQVSFPKDPDKADKLREYCLNNGLGSMLTINHNSLNSLYKSKKEELEIEGKLDFSNVLDGVDEPKVYKTISFRKG